jgi:hypothetical protein
MTSRCKSGDLAVILHDVPSCTPNIGRVVQVHGPSAINLHGQLTWLIKPVTAEPYLLNDWNDEFAGFMAFDDNDIEHPDDWMMPIRPDPLDDDTEEPEDLSRGKEVVTCQ